MEQFKTHNKGQIYTALGYDKKNPIPGRNYKTFSKLTRVFFKDYEATGRRIPLTKVNPEEAHKCALRFLEDETVPLRFFPPAEDGNLVWPKDKEQIIMGVTHLFRNCANSARSRETRPNTAYTVTHDFMTNPTTSPKKRGRPPKTKSKAQSENECTFSNPNQSQILKVLPGLPYLDSNPSQPLPWRRPSTRFSHPDGLQYIRQLRPHPNQPDVKALIVDWLFEEQQEEVLWPTFMDKFLERLMHHNNFYASPVSSDERCKHITEAVLERFAVEISEQQFTQLQSLVCHRICWHTEDYENRHFICEVDGIKKKTERFEKLWESREEHWKVIDYEIHDYSDDYRPKKKRVKRSSKLQTSEFLGDYTSEGAKDLERRHPSDSTENALDAFSQRRRDEVALEGPAINTPEEKIIIDLDTYVSNQDTIKVHVPDGRHDDSLFGTSCVQPIPRNRNKASSIEEPPYPGSQDELCGQVIATIVNEQSREALKVGCDDSSNETMFSYEGSNNIREAPDLLQLCKDQAQVLLEEHIAFRNSPEINSSSDNSSLPAHRDSPFSAECINSRAQEIASGIEQWEKGVESLDTPTKEIIFSEKGTGCSISNVFNAVREAFPAQEPTVTCGSSESRMTPADSAPSCNSNCLPGRSKTSCRLDFGAIRQDLVIASSTSGENKTSTFWSKELPKSSGSIRSHFSAINQEILSLSDSSKNINSSSLVPGMQPPLLSPEFEEFIPRCRPAPMPKEELPREPCANSSVSYDKDMKSTEQTVSLVTLNAVGYVLEEATGGNTSHTSEVTCPLPPVSESNKSHISSEQPAKSPTPTPQDLSPQSPLLIDQTATERRRPYSLAPPPMRYSLLPDSELNSISLPDLSSDTRIALHSTSSTFQTATTEQLVLVFQHLDLDFDFDDKIEYAILENSSRSQFFAFFSAKSGVPLSLLRQLTFVPMFGNGQSFTTTILDGHEKWSRMRLNLHNIYKRELKKNRKREKRETEFQIWVEIEDTNGLKL